MTYALLLLSLALAGPRAVATSSKTWRCHDLLHKTAFFQNAPEPYLLVYTFVDRLDSKRMAMMGPVSIRHRLGRAFARYLLQKFGVLDDLAAGPFEFEVRGHTYRVSRSSARHLAVHSPGAPRPVIDWDARRGYGQPSARRALDLDAKDEPSDTWLDLHPTFGIEVLGHLIEARLPSERRPELRRDLDAWMHYLADIEQSFAHYAEPVDEKTGKVTPKPAPTLH